MNKLTLEKFDRLSTEFCALEFSTLERVAGAVDLIVTKAQTESHFVSVYASLCVKLANTPNEALGEDEGSTKSSGDYSWKGARPNLSATIVRPSPSWNL